MLNSHEIDLRLHHMTFDDVIKTSKFNAPAVVLLRDLL